MEVLKIAAEWRIFVRKEWVVISCRGVRKRTDFRASEKFHSRKKEMMSTKKRNLGWKPSFRFAQAVFVRKLDDEYQTLKLNEPEEAILRDPLPF